MKHSKLLTGTLLVVLMLGACKTSEKNYRTAYERATAANDRDVTEFDKTIYNRYRAQMRDVPESVDGKTIDTRMARVAVTKDGGGINEWLGRYSVVVAEFKQLFNAKSLRNRFTAAGYPRCFIVENGEPYYYIVADSSDDLARMANLCDSLRASSPVPLKEGFPYILQVPR